MSTAEMSALTTPQSHLDAFEQLAGGLNGEPPALAALLDTLDASFAAPDGRPARAHLVVPHRLQPFSPAYHDGRDPRLFTFRPPVGRAERDPAAIRHDLDQGYVTPDGARDHYGFAG